MRNWRLVRHRGRSGRQCPYGHKHRAYPYGRFERDGTVFASGWNKHGQCEVSDWRGMLSIAAGWRHTIGLKANGSVIAAGRNQQGECDVSDWHDIVAVATGDRNTVGLKADGTVIAICNN